MIEKKYLAPNAITASNMLLGYLSIVSSIDGDYVRSVWFIIAAMVCDTLDGKTARKLDAFSEFGKEFDSFCDAISFGLAPGVLILSILKETPIAKYMIPISFIYALCGVMRLVKFNIITTASSEKDDFSGMPIPCGAALVVGYYLLCHTAINSNIFGGVNLFSPEIFSIISIIAAVLMVSLVPFKTPDKVFAFIPKKMFPFFLIAVLVTLKYSLFIFAAYYVLVNLGDYFMRKGVLGPKYTISNDEDENEEELEENKKGE